MDKQQSLVIFVILSSVLVTIVSQMPSVSAAPSYSSANYDKLRELYELIMGNKLLADAYGENHQMIRKNSRSPSLRLRFGRRSDPSFYQGPPIDERLYQSLPDVATSEN